jgi:hypothetical protein
MMSAESWRASARSNEASTSPTSFYADCTDVLRLNRSRLERQSSIIRNP